MTVLHYSNGPQYLNSDHVTYYVMSKSQIKVPELESNLVVHSSIKMKVYHESISFTSRQCVMKWTCVYSWQILADI